MSAWSGVPTQYWRMLEHPDFESYDLSSLAMVSSGGAPFPPELMRVLNEKIPTAQLSNGYGMSESMGAGTLLSGARYVTHRDVGRCAVPDASRSRSATTTAPCCPRGEVGEIALHGAVIFKGYWDNPEATAAVLDDERWYHTGDYGRIDDGVLWLESRMRDLILRGGENIYPMEIEHRLVEHPDIADAAVIGVDHRTLGQEVKAFVVLRDGRRAHRGRGAGVGGAGAGRRSRCRPTSSSVTHSRTPQTGKVMKHELEREQQQA